MARGEANLSVRGARKPPKEAKEGAAGNKDVDYSRAGNWTLRVLDSGARIQKPTSANAKANSIWHKRPPAFALTAVI